MLSKHSYSIPALMISQMHWIVTYFDHRNTKKAIVCFKQCFVGISLFWKKIGISPLLGENEYKCCLNTLIPSLTLMISQMHWIVTYSDLRNTKRTIDCFKQCFVCFNLFWEKMGISVV
ncbi:hypothetical protein AtNW77_Chr00c002g0321131 [Arabidopsis thaliana]